LNKKIPLLIFSFFIFFVAGLAVSVFPSPLNILRVHFLGVGYGDAIFIQFPEGSTMMIDSGEEEYAANACRYLQSLGTAKIDTVVITHPHTNHFAGFKRISEVFPVGRVFINGDKNAEEGYFELLEGWRQKNIPVNVLKKGDKILPGGFSFKLLHPQKIKNVSANDNSLVCWLKYKNISLLFMGDIESEGQKELLKNFKNIKEADVIKMPHHGGPVIDELVKKIQDKILIISTGPNPWGLPQEGDMKKLRGKIYRTDQMGTIIVETDGRNVTVKPAKLQGLND